MKPSCVNCGLPKSQHKLSGLRDGDRGRPVYDRCPGFDTFKFYTPNPPAATRGTKEQDMPDHAPKQPTIGDHYDDCRKRADAAWQKLCEARRNGASAEEIRRLEKAHDYAAYTGD